MGETVLDDPGAFFAQLGGLHDAEVTAFSWSRDGSTAVLWLDDLNSAYLDLPEYLGRRPVKLVFTGASLCNATIDRVDAPLWIYDLTVATVEARHLATLELSPGGVVMFNFDQVRMLE